MEFKDTSITNKQSQPPLGVSFIEGDLISLEKTSSSVSESGLDGGSNKNIQIPTRIDVAETSKDDDLIGLGKKSAPSSPSSSSSSSDSFDENFFLMDENEARRSSVAGNDLLHLDEDDVSSHDLLSSNPVSPQHDLSVSPASSQNVSSKQPPPMQLMDRFEPPDPNRIPASVFARTKSTAPVEWSTQSNESLFSIHMGNNSFSRDQIFLMGRSQELGKSDDMFKFPNNTSTDINAGAADYSNIKSPGIGVAEVAAETMKEVIRESAQDGNKSKITPEAMRISHRSDGSNASTMSFAFPTTLTKDGTKSGSEKVEAQKETQEQKQSESTNTPAPPQAGENASETSWFSCLSCSCCR